MNPLLGLSRAIDALNRTIGRSVSWLVLIATLVSSFNAISRKAFDLSSNGMLEAQWYLFSAVFLLCAGYTLLNNEHVRVDVLFGRLSRRRQLMVETLGTLLFLAPMAILVFALSWAPFLNAFSSGEVSSNAGGLIRWPVKLLIPVGFGLLILQGISELIKNIDEFRRLASGSASPR